MEVWWIGSSSSPLRMLVALATTFVAVLLLIRTAGFHNGSEFRLRDAAIIESGEQQFDFVSGGESEEGNFCSKPIPDRTS